MRVVGLVACAACAAACGRLGIDRVANGDAGDAPVDVPSDVPPDMLPTTDRHWVNAQHADPGLLLGARAVFSKKLGAVVMYGGDHAHGLPPPDPSAALWSYDGRAWRRLCDPCSPGPGALFAPAMAYDSKRDRVVLYGGADKVGTTSELWAWDGTWTQIETPVAGISPGRRAQSQMAYDPRRDRIVLFGGIVDDNFNRYDASVFELDGDQWSAVSVTGDQPPGIGGAGQAALWNPVTEQIDVLEDQGPGVDASDATWSWNGSAWSKLCGPCTGIARRDASIVFDPSPPRTYEIGGYDGVRSTEIAGTWQRDGSGTRMVSMQPDKRDSVAVAYDAARDAYVLYGGNGAACFGNCSETWELVRD
jgi:hypothetical protein